MHETLKLWQVASLEATDWFKCLRGAMPINSLVSLLVVIEICINEGWIIKEREWITRDKTMSQEWELRGVKGSSLLKDSVKFTVCHSQQPHISSSPASFSPFKASGWIWRCQKLIWKAAERWKLFLHTSPAIFRSICCSWLHNRAALPVLQKQHKRKKSVPCQCQTEASTGGSWWEGLLHQVNCFNHTLNKQL